MDEQLILDTAEARAPALRALAREILEAAHLGVSLDAADVLLRRAEGAPAVHITAAAHQLLEHLAAIEGATVPDQGIMAVLASAGTQLLVRGIELDEARWAGTNHSLELAANCSIADRPVDRWYGQG